MFQATDPSFWNQIISWLAEQTPGALYGNIIWVVVVGSIGAIAARTWVRRQNRPFEGWTIQVIKADGEIGTDRKISVTKMKQVLADDSDMSVFIKGVASTYGWLNVDPMTKGRENGLLTIAERKIIVDLTKNPKSSPPPKPATKQEIAAEVIAQLVAMGVIKLPEA
jgi:hypothetical protein